MSVTHPPQPRRDAQVVTLAADADADQRAAEANSAIILMACLLGLVGGTQLLVSFLGRFA